MTDQMTHLTEDERHTAADGTLSVEQRAHVEAHLAACDTCAADVARIAEFMKRTREATAPVAEPPLDDLWLPIRARIEATKVVSLDSSEPTMKMRRLGWFSVAGLAAAVLLGALVLRGRAPVTQKPTVARIGADTSILRAVNDSTRAYEAEAQILLDRLEIQRATMRPDAVAAIDRNLRTVDVAIAELKDAIARDPNNPALRQLLATSYRQKVELLKRVGNTG